MATDSPAERESIRRSCGNRPIPLGAVGSHYHCRWGTRLWAIADQSIGNGRWQVRPELQLLSYGAGEVRSIAPVRPRSRIDREDCIALDQHRNRARPLTGLVVPHHALSRSTGHSGRFSPEGAKSCCEHAGEGTPLLYGILQQIGTGVNAGPRLEHPLHTGPVGTSQE